MNIFEKINKLGLARDDVVDVVFILKIYDKYLTKNVKKFVEFLIKKDNFVYFMMEMPHKINQVQNVKYIESSITNPYKDGTLSNDDLYKIDKDVMRDILLNYYLSEANDSSLYYKTYGENFPYSMYLFNIYRIEFKEIVKKQYVEPIIANLYPLSKNLKEDSKFDEDFMLKNFYIKVTTNSFTTAVTKFEDIIMPKCLEILESDLRQSFEKHSRDAIEHVKYWSVSFVDKGEKSKFFNQNYSSEAKEKWIPVLNKSKIDLDMLCARLIAKSLEQYMFGYAMKHTIVTRSKLKSILIENSYFTLEFASLVSYINEVVKLKSEINYLFVKLLSKNCDLNNKEITFLINTLTIEGKSLSIRTYKNKEKDLPFIDKSYHEFGWE